MSNDYGAMPGLRKAPIRLVPAKGEWHKSADLDSRPGMHVDMLCDENLRMAAHTEASAWPDCTKCMQAHHEQHRSDT